MNKKRLAEEERGRLQRKIRRLERKIKDLPDSDPEENESAVESAVTAKESTDVEVDSALFEFAEEPEEITEEQTDKLDDSILEALGVESITEKKTESLRKEIADVWTATIKKGLNKENKEAIEKELVIFDNIPNIPKLNPEAGSMMSDMAKRRDSIIESRQRQLSSVLGCLGSALHLCIADAEANKVATIKKINEAARLVCDSIYLDTKGRRSLILSAINKDMKEVLSYTEPEDFLFGEKLCEKISAAKTVKKSGEELKIPSKAQPQQRRQEAFKKNASSQALNWRGPPRPAEPRSQRGRQAGPRHQTRPQERKKPTMDSRSSRPYHR